jgi:hypothetical protein
MKLRKSTTENWQLFTGCCQIFGPSCVLDVTTWVFWTLSFSSIRTRRGNHPELIAILLYMNVTWVTSEKWHGWKLQVQDWSGSQLHCETTETCMYTAMQGEWTMHGSGYFQSPGLNWCLWHSITTTSLCRWKHSRKRYKAQGPTALMGFTFIQNS